MVETISTKNEFYVKKLIKSMELGCIYLITCLVSRRQYVGLSKHINEQKRYKGHWDDVKYNRHDSILHRAMRKHGIENFKVERLCIVPHQSLSNMEQYYAEQFETYIWDNPGGYNMIVCGGIGRLGIRMKDSTKNKIRNAHLGRKVNDQGKENMSVAQKLRFQLNPAPPCSEEQKKKLSESNIGKQRTEETKQNIKNARKRYYENRTDEERQQHVERAKHIYQNVKDKLNSPEAIMKRTLANTGKTHSEETKQLLSEKAKQREHQNPPPIPTEETKQKLSKLRKEESEKWWNERFTIDEIQTIRQRYKTTKISQVNLAKELNINVKTLIRILRREVFPNC